MKTKNKRDYLKQNGITLIALVVTIVVLLILAGVTINALFGDTGIIKRAQDAQNKMDQAAENDLTAINGFNEWIDRKVNNITDISTLLGKTVDKNTKAEDAYGNKITIPKGFKILPHGTDADSATYTYSGDNIPTVQDGIVIENGADGNQFVWVPVGTIKNKDNTTNTITLGRYSDFTMIDGAVIDGQPVDKAEDYTSVNIKKDGSIYGYTDSPKANKTFIENTLKNGGYYIARFEAGINGDKDNESLATETPTDGSVKPQSKRGLGVWNGLTRFTAGLIASKMYYETEENDELIYASSLINGYAWDTAIIFIQTYSTEKDASTYASQNKSTSFANTGINNDKYCNIWDMSGNAIEWSTEDCDNQGHQNSTWFNVTYRGGNYNSSTNEVYAYTSNRSFGPDNFGAFKVSCGFRISLIVGMSK